MTTSALPDGQPGRPIITARSVPAISSAEQAEVVGARVDLGDPDLIATAFSDDAAVDFGPCGRKMGLEFPMMSGSETIVGFLGATARTQTPATSSRKAASTSKETRAGCERWSTRRIGRRTTILVVAGW